MVVTKIKNMESHFHGVSLLKRWKRQQAAHDAVYDELCDLVRISLSEHAPYCVFHVP